MPTLDHLQALMGGEDFEVVALAVDRAGRPAVDAFFLETDVKYLGFYIDSTSKALRDLGIFGLPTTLLIGRDGRELGRRAGAADWDGVVNQPVRSLRTCLRIGENRRPSRGLGGCAAVSWPGRWAPVCSICEFLVSATIRRHHDRLGRMDMSKC
jgi:hypothetical protein